MTAKDSKCFSPKIHAEYALTEYPSTPGFKFADWELKGVPLRLEFGPKDAANNVVTFARRDTNEKGTIPIDELASRVPELLETIQKDLFAKADASFRSHRLQLTEWDKVVPALDSKNVVLIPFCEEHQGDDQERGASPRLRRQEAAKYGHEEPVHSLRAAGRPGEG
jgi:prolyl-tRNA synthetase